MPAELSWAVLLRDLGINAGLMSVLLLGYALLPASPAMPLQRRLAEGLGGLLFGAGAVLALQAPLSVAPGVLVDAKTVVLALAGAFLAPRAALLAVLIGVGYRAWLGGVGALAGAGAMASAAALGWLWQRWRLRSTPPPASGWWLASLGAAVSLVALAWTVTLPMPLVTQLLPKLMVPVPLVFTLGIIGFGSLLEALRQRQLTLEQLRAQRDALEQTERRFRMVYEATPDAMGLIRRRDNLLLDVNPAFERLLGRPRESALGHTMATLSVWDDLAERERLLAALRPDGIVDSMEARWRRADGKLLVGLVSVRPLHMDGEACVLFTFRDLTERREIEQQAQLTRQEQAAAEAAANARSQFLAHMSHEIRTPLNAIIGLTELALRSHDHDRQRDYLQRSKQAAMLLLDLIGQVLDFAKIEGGHLELESRAFALGDVMARVASLVGAITQERGVKLTMQIDPAAPGHLIGDAARLTQVLINLCSNAAKFSPDGGEALVTVAALACDEQRCELRFAVRDHGIGIGADQLPRLFQPFSQGDSSVNRRFGGSGLGLVISRQLVRAMGGDIGVTSTLGQGSEFSFALTFARAAASTAGEPLHADAVPAAAARPLQGRHLLVVEDNLVNQIVAHALLEDGAGASVTLADSGAQALEQLAAARFDAVLMDVQMPQMDGYEATRRIRGMVGLETLPIIAVTAHASVEERDACLEAGMNDFLTKPFVPDVLTAKVAHWVQGRPFARGGPAATWASRP